MVGSEGTLGVITELTLKLHGIPEAISAGICPFPSVEAACNATILTIQSGIPVARIELLDELQVKAGNAYSKLTLPETPMLLVEFHGSEAGVAEQAERFGEIAADLGGGPFEWATKAEDRTKLWQARHDAYWARAACARARRRWRPMCACRSRGSPNASPRRRPMPRETGLIAPIVGHVGDGNFHVTPAGRHGRRRRDEEGEAVPRAARRARACAWKAPAPASTASGRARSNILLAEHGPVAIGVMRAIKQALDPHNIMNPGKILPAG